MKHLTLSLALSLLLVLSAATEALAQGGYINQTAIESILQRRAESLDDIPEVYYNYRILSETTGNSVIARNRLYKIWGHGDQQLGQERAKLVELINRRLLAELSVGDTIVVPTEFELDFRAYSPFPRYYI